MNVTTAQNLLAADSPEGRVTIGLTAPETLRRLSDARLLSCPGCKGRLTLHAGTVRAHHFAHLPGAVCRLPQSEPETDEHRAGKILLARWLQACLPDAEIVVEAWLPATNQRADVLAILPQANGKPRRVALEFQCANLAARSWRQRHALYRQSGIQDLWMLGGSRLHRETTPDDKSVTLRTTELERALLWDNAPLLFLDAAGERLPAETLARFRPEPNAQALRPAGRLSARPLLALPFPWLLLDWPLNPEGQGIRDRESINPISDTQTPIPASEWRLWEWLIQRFRVTPDTLSPFFGLPIAGQEALTCEARTWQAALYYRFVHRRVGDGWWLTEVETWTRAYLPLFLPVNIKRLRAVLSGYQEALAAAGFLSLPTGYNRANARITADLSMLPALPDREEVLRLARYRRTLHRA